MTPLWFSNSIMCVAGFVESIILSVTNTYSNGSIEKLASPHLFSLPLFHLLVRGSSGHVVIREEELPVLKQKVVEGTSVFYRILSAALFDGLHCGSINTTGGEQGFVF